MSKPKGKSTRRGKHAKTREGENDGREGALAYKVLSADQTRELLALSVEHIQMKICDIFKLNNFPTDLKEASTADYYTAAVWWGKEHGFNVQQLSGFFTLIHTVFGNVKEKNMCLVENLKEFKKMMAGIGVDSHADNQYGGLEFFDVSQAKAVSNYVYTSFFQHYKLYENMFSHTQAEEIIGTDLEINVAMAADVPFPPPLDEGISEDCFVKYVATPPPTPIPEPAEKTAEDEREAAEEKLAAMAETDLFAELTPEDVKEVIESVAMHMLGGLRVDVASKLREKENQIIAKLNKIHKVADA